MKRYAYIATAILLGATTLGTLGAIEIANAQTSGTATLTLSVEPPPIRSISITPGNPAYYRCFTRGFMLLPQPMLTLPLGECQSEIISMQIGPAPSMVKVSSSLVTSETGANWTPMIHNPINNLFPGHNQVRISLIHLGGGSAIYPGSVGLALAPVSWNTAPIQNTTKSWRVELKGPETSSSPDLIWTHTVTFAVVPPA
jgi:hypothetical protein